MPTGESEQHPRILLSKLNFGAPDVTLAGAVPHLEQPHTARCKFPLATFTSHCFQKQCSGSL